jgi:beta-hydroxylase
MGLAVFALFVFCGIYVQHHGVVQHEKLSRKLTDHANIFGPINCLFCSLSKVYNHRLYYLLQYALYAWLIYLIFF